MAALACVLPAVSPICLAALQPPQSPAARDEDPAAWELAQRAQGAQGDGDLQYAARLWAELLERFPNWSERAKAHHNLGLCLAQRGEYEQAIPHFESAIRELPADAVETLAGAHLYLGFSQLELGRAIKASDSTRSGQLLTTSTVTLGRLVQNWPDYRGVHEALWYQGNAFEELGRLDEARKAWEQAAADSAGKYRSDAIYALGWLDQKGGRYAEAVTRYREFLATASTSPLAGEVRLRCAEAMSQLAAAAAARGDRPEQTRWNGEAAALLTPLLEDGGFIWRDEALFLAGTVADREGDHAQALTRFLAVTALTDSPVRHQAALNAALQALQLDQPATAQAMLELAITAADAGTASRAAHELSRLLRSTGAAARAAELAREWSPRAPSPAAAAELLLDEAEALLQVEGAEQSAASVLARIGKEFTDTPAAPLALYNSVWLANRMGQYGQALQLAGQFAERFPGHAWRPDVEEIRASVLARQEDSAAAAGALRSLADSYPQHPRRAQWLVSLAAEQVRGGELDQALATAAQVSDDEQLAPAVRAHASYWTALAEQKAGRFEQAIAALQRSLTLADDWERRDDVLGTMAVCQYQAGHAGDAEKTVEALRKEHPGSPALLRSLLALGDAGLARSDWEAAGRWFRMARDEFASDPASASAAAGLAWAELRLGHADDAARLFREVIDRRPGPDREADATRGLAAALRVSGNPGEAVSALRARLAALPEDADPVPLQYELVLALIQADDRAGAAQLIDQLLPLPVAARLADRLRYEQAWLRLNGGDAEGAMESFAIIAREFPDSQYAADAAFQLGERDYNAGQYEAAARWYQRSLDHPAAPAGVRERAAYKLAWTAWRRKDFAAAQAGFAGLVAQFPDGEFHDDALFMNAECLFAQDRFAETVTALKDSAGAIAASQRIQPANRLLAWLHGAQAANKAGLPDDALAFAQRLTADESAPEEVRLDAWLEAGNALKSLDRLDDAAAAWQHAAASLGRTGARAWCLIADRHFVERRFDEAVNAYKNVIYGFGGSGEDPEIDPWQAYALYEAGLCYTVQIETADPAARADLIANAIRLFEKLCREHPADGNVPEATKNLEKLKRLAGTS